VYGSFNTVVFDQAFPVPKKLSTELATLQQRYHSKLMTSTSRLSSDGLSDCSTVISRNTSCESLTSLVSDVTTVVGYGSNTGSPITSHGGSVANNTSTTTGNDVIPTAVFGPTCDGLDQMCTLESTQLERCQVGDWLIWENQGAYTHTASFIFNGYTHFPNKIHCFLA